MGKKDILLMGDEMKLNKKGIAMIAAASAVVVAIAVGTALSVYDNGPIKPKELVENTDVKLGSEVSYAAHRGLSGVAPENTLPAFIEAGKAGYWAAECDIHLTKDNVWVLMHDSSIKRMTNGTGKVSDYTYAELQAFEIDNGANIENYLELRIPTLDEYLEVCAEYNMVPIIEIKQKGSIDFSNILFLLSKYELLTRAYIIDFDFNHLKEIKELEPSVCTMWLTKSMTEKTIKKVAELPGNRGIDVKANNKLTAELVDQAKAEGLRLNCWTVDTIKRHDQMVDIGFRVITTNCILP